MAETDYFYSISILSYPSKYGGFILVTPTILSFCKRVNYPN